MALRPSLSPAPIRNARHHRRQRVTAIRSVRESLVSLAGLMGSPVLNQSGEIGRLQDVVARWDGEERYPAVTGLVVQIGRRRAFVSIDEVRRISHGSVELRAARVDRDFARREGEVLLARDVVDHQLVDVDGVQVIRAADLYLAIVPGATGPVLRLVGVDVSAQTLLRRLGPKRWRNVPTPERVIDWAAIQPFGGEVRDVRLRASNEGLRRLRPGELADLLEDLGRDARQELLASLEPDKAADALEEMDPEELGALLRETPPEEAALLLARMEPDEAVDALRDLDRPEREELLAHMAEDKRAHLAQILHYEEDRAGGIMTTNLVTAVPDEPVGAVRERLRSALEHAGDIDGVAVVDDEGSFLGDVSLFHVAVADDDGDVGALLSEREPVMVAAEAQLAEVAERLIESRHSSVVVVDEGRRPIGRILADDVVDALIPERGRLHFPRLLQ
jgi:CBS domain-containing protein